MTTVPAVSLTRSLKVVVALLGAVTPAACKDVSAPPAAVPPASIVASSPVTATGVAGLPIADLPSVVVRDESGRPLSGATVLFMIVKGDGALTGASVSTDGAGKATLKGWTLARKAGLNTVAATTGSLGEVRFDVTGVAGPPVAVEKLDGDGQVVAPGSAVPISPLVFVRDSNGNAVAGVKVTFSIAEGDASLTGAEVLSSAAGIAGAGTWILGTAGSYAIEAKVAGLAPALFTALAVQPCSQQPSLASGVTSGVLTASDCSAADERFADYYAVQVDTARVYEFAERSSSFAPSLALLSGGVPVALRDDPKATADGAVFKVSLSPGTYVLRASSVVGGAVGEYRISWSPSEFPFSCEETFIVAPVDIQGWLTDKDCLDGGERFNRHYRIFLRAGVLLQAAIDADYDGGFLELQNTAAEQVATGTTSGYVTTLNFIPTRSGFYLLRAGYLDSRTIGPFSLTVR